MMLLSERGPHPSPPLIWEGTHQQTVQLPPVALSLLWRRHPLTRHSDGAVTSNLNLPILLLLHQAQSSGQGQSSGQVTKATPLDKSPRPLLWTSRQGHSSGQGQSSGQVAKATPLDKARGQTITFTQYFTGIH